MCILLSIISVYILIVLFEISTIISFRNIFSDLKLLINADSMIIDRKKNNFYLFKTPRFRNADYSVDSVNKLFLNQIEHVYFDTSKRLPSMFFKHNDILSYRYEINILTCWLLPVTTMLYFASLITSRIKINNMKNKSIIIHDNNEGKIV